MEPAPDAIRLFDRYAERYAAKYMDVGLYGEALDAFCALLPDGAEVLELACGPGNVTRYMLDRRPDLRVLGTDLAPTMLELARTHVPEASFEPLDQRAITTLGRTFDGLVCAFGLPYLSGAEAAQLIADAARVVRPGGALYLSTMEDDPARSGWEGPGEGELIYMNYHLGADLIATLSEHGFTLVKELRATSPAPKGGITTDMMLVARH